MNLSNYKEKIVNLVKNKKTVVIAASVIVVLLVLSLTLVKTGVISGIFSGRKTGNRKLGETFNINLFDYKLENKSEYELTIDKDYSIVNVDNKFSTYYNKKAIKIGVTLKNNKNESEYLFVSNGTGPTYKDEEGNNKNDLDTTVSMAFSDALLTGTLESGGHVDGSIYILYNGKGTYELKIGGSTVEFTVNK